MSRILKFLIPLIIILAAAGYYFAPVLWAKSVPGFLNKNIASFIVVDDAQFSRSPPELILTNVHLQNPAQFGLDDAITIGKINIVFDDYSHSPYHINSVTVQHIRGKYIEREDTDNFSILHAALMDKKIQTPRDELAKKVILKKFVIHDASVTSEDGKTILPLPQKSLTPIENEMVLQKVIIDVLGTVIEQQKTGTVPLAVNSLAGKAEETLKSIGESLKNYLTTP